MRIGTPSFLAWPGRRLLAYALILGAGQMVWFCLVYGGADWITAQRATRFPVHWDMERYTPFVPAMIVFYMSLYLLFAAAPFVLRTVQQLNALSATLACVIFVAGLCFLAFPAELAYTMHRDWGMWARWYAVADQMNLRYNLVPSLHVTLSLVCVEVFASHAQPAGKRLLWLWGGAIALSTVLTHEHHLLDVATGFLLARAGVRLIYRRLTSSSSDRLCKATMGDQGTLAHDSARCH